MTASALHGSGDDDVVTLTGSWAVKNVSISFLNDAYGGTPSTDRNLYLAGIANNGTLYANSSAALYTDGTQSLAVSKPGGATPADSLTVYLSEDAYKGNADFDLTVDGKQVTTAQAVTTLHSSGAWEAFTIAGNFGAGTHIIGVTFTNDLYGGTASTDRNLYVDGVSVNGTRYGSGVSSLFATGSTASFTVATSH
jgi:hypothetical protein